MGPLGTFIIENNSVNFPIQYSLFNSSEVTSQRGMCSVLILRRDS